MTPLHMIYIYIYICVLIIPPDRILKPVEYSYWVAVCSSFCLFLFCFLLQNHWKEFCENHMMPFAPSVWLSSSQCILRFTVTWTRSCYISTVLHMIKHILTYKFVRFARSYVYFIGDKPPFNCLHGKLWGSLWRKQWLIQDF